MNDDGGSFDFGTAFEPLAGRIQAPTPLMTRAPVPLGPRRRGQPLAWTALGAAVVAALAIGGGLFTTLARIELPVDAAIDGVQTWLTLTAGGLCIALVAAALAIIALVRSRPHTVAVVSLVAALVLPPIAAIIGIRAGVYALTEHLQDAGDQAATMLASAADEYARTGSVSVAALLQLVRQFIHT